MVVGPVSLSPEAEMSDLLMQLNSELSEVIERVRPSLVEISNGHGGIGAGTIWHPDGLIVTNAHVVRRHRLKVKLLDGRILPARLLARDTGLDLAALKVDAENLPTIELGRSRRLQPGQWVWLWDTPGECPVRSPPAWSLV
jgi:serine protease Do